MKVKRPLPPKPTYNLAATRKRFLASGRKYRPWALTKGLNPNTFAMFMSGSFVPTVGGEVEWRFMSALAADELLVMKEAKQRNLNRRKDDDAGTTLLIV